MATAPDGSPGGAEGSPVAGGIDGAALAMRMVQAAEAAAARQPKQLRSWLGDSRLKMENLGGSYSPSHLCSITVQGNWRSQTGRSGVGHLNSTLPRWMPSF